MGLPKKNRLRDRQDFRDIYSQGIRQNSLHLVLRALSTSKLENQHLDCVYWGNPSTPLGQFLIEPTRLGVSISQKVSKKAVIRNRIKRQIQAAFRELLPSISPGWKIVIVVRSRAIECKYEHFLRELEQLLKKAKIINGH